MWLAKPATTAWHGSRCNCCQCTTPDGCSISTAMPAASELHHSWPCEPGHAQHFQKSMEHADQRLAATDAHGEQKVNFWQAPTDIPKWKEEQVLSVSKLSMYTVCDRNLLILPCISLLCCAFLCCMPNYVYVADCAGSAVCVGRGHLHIIEGLWRKEGRVPSTSCSCGTLTT